MRNTSVFPVLLLGLALTATSAHAALITWGAPTNQTGNVTDIVTTGQLHGSAHSGNGIPGADITVNGVRFEGATSQSGGNVTFDASPVSLRGFQVANAQFGPQPPAGWDAAYRALVYGGAYQGNSIPGCTVGTNCPYIRIDDLTVGSQYVVQIFEAFWNTNWATTFITGANQVTLNMAGPATGGAQASSVAQYVVGEFTADSTSLNIYLNSATDYAVFNSIQVRELPARVPEPTSLALVGMAMLGLALARRRSQA